MNNRGSFEGSRKQQGSTNQGHTYEIRVKGQVSPKLSEWYFENITISNLGDGTSLLTGWIADQSALFGLLNLIFNWNLEIISLNRVDLLNDPDKR